MWPIALMSSKEKEKNMTTLAIYHGVLLVTVDDYLWNDIRTSIKQISIKVDLYSAVILKSYFWCLVFCKCSIRVSCSCN